MTSCPSSVVLIEDPIVLRVRSAAPIPHDVQHCRWADSGFPVAWPVWLDSSGFDWACRREALRMLPTPRVCLTCPRWEPRQR